MTNTLIKTRDLRKSYVSRHGRQIAVDGLNLEVQSGGVHGFLGPNGSGKTTTIRMVLGLSRPDSGAIELCGEQIPAGLGSAMADVGAVVEQPRLFNGFTGRVNLELLARTAGLDKARVDQVLADVGMSQRAKDRYGAYSLGMKQRLAIAGAMLRQPRLLILDEPTNGLDPAGIREIRTLIRRLADEGTTVLVSSHILAEVQQICDAVTIIARGKMLASGPVADVLASVAGGGATFHVAVPDVAAARSVLTGAGYAVSIDKAALVVTGAADAADITKTLAQQGIYLTGLQAVGGDLESAFLQITEGQGLW